MLHGHASHKRNESAFENYGVFEKPANDDYESENSNDSEKAEAGTLGKDLAASYTARTSRMSIEPPADFAASDDLSQPACWRNRGLSREINLR